MLKLERIKIDGGTQQRAEICLATVAEYAEAYLADEEMPPVAVMYDGVDHWLIDGFHRYHAARKAGMTHIDADITHGTRREAVLHSVGVNVAHGLRRTNADKRKAVQTLLDDDEWCLWSNEAIAKACVVSPHTVAELKSISANAEIEPTKFERNGKTHLINTANIGTNRGNKAVMQHGESKAVEADAGKPVSSQKPQPEPPPHGEHDDFEVEQLHDALDAVREENEKLTDRLAVAAMDATDEEKTAAAELIAGLREENRMLKINLDAVTASRDGLMLERNEMIKQIKAQRRELDKLKK